MLTISPEVREFSDALEDNGYSFTVFVVQEMMDYGIETISQFEDAYQGQHLDGASFAESLCEDCGYLHDYQTDKSLPAFILNHIDWGMVWSRELSFDYFEVDCHFFSNNF